MGRVGIFLAAAFLLFGPAPISRGEDVAGPPEPHLLLKRMFTPELVADKLLPPLEPEYCGVEIQAMVAAAWPDLEAGLKAAIPDHLRPFELRRAGDKAPDGTEVCDAFLDSEHFRIHYSTDPEHQPRGYPDLGAVHALAANLEDAYVYHRDISGMGVVLPDGEFGGGTDLIDCYYYLLSGGKFGWATGLDNIENGCDNSLNGVFAVTIDSGTRDFESQQKCTSEHEYYHLLQYAHNFRQSSWVLESTARNSEFHVWPEHANPWGVWQWMTHPYYPVYDGTDFHRYAPHFWIYLEAQFGWDFTTRIWKRACHQPVIDALFEEIGELGADMDDILTDFALWNYFSGERDDGRHYDPLYQIPAPYHQVAYWEFPVLPFSLPEGKTARPAGTNYVRFYGPAESTDLKVTFNGHPDMSDERAVTVLAVNDWGHESWRLEPDAAGSGSITVPDWGLYDYVTLVVSNFWDAPSDSSLLAYSYAAEEVDQAPGPVDGAGLRGSFPNPFRESTRVFFYTPRDGTPTTIRVYDLSGRLVRTLVNESMINGMHQIVWDGRDNRGRSASAGIYLVRMDSGGYLHSGKVMLVK